MDELIDRFSPDRLNVSGKLYAVLGALLGRRWTEPWYEEIAVTSDGHVLGALPDGRSEYLAVVSDLEENLRGVVDAVGLTSAERLRLAEIIESHLTVHENSFDVYETLGVIRPDPLMN